MVLTGCLASEGRQARRSGEGGGRPRKASAAANSDAKLSACASRSYTIRCSLIAPPEYCASLEARWAEAARWGAMPEASATCASRYCDQRHAMHSANASKERALSSWT